ncbi:ATP-grasp domain-containing protein [Prosthecobacter sp.]|uniref:ATP-grasp domain-containing protein n=1 Tax=Prosthecobacter sp. TaxID=1965333 RepID=UPI0037836B9C
MFKRVYLEQKEPGKLGQEESLVREECERLGVEVVPCLRKQIQRRQLPLTRECFICGSIDVMHGAMKQLGIEVPEPNDFPKSLEPFFHRKIWRSTVKGLMSLLEYGREVFAKPAGRQKYFNGRVFGSQGDTSFVYGVSRQEPVWCSEIVNWRSEFRIYVVGAEIVAQRHYWGDPTVLPSQSTLEEAIRIYSASGEAPAAYGIDFGVLDTGETALVEANDGYSLGAYDMDAASYSRVLFTRWQELVRT